MVVRFHPGSLADLLGSSVDFHRGAFAIFWAACRCSLCTEDVHPEVPDGLIEGLEVLLAEGGRGREFRFEYSDIGQGTLDLVSGAFLQDLGSLLGQLGAVADHEEVVAGLKSQADHLVEAVVVEDRSHVEVVSHDEPLESHLLPEELGRDGRCEGSRESRGVELGEGDVTHHHAVNGVGSGGEMTEDLELVSFELCEWSWQSGELVVGIAGGG